MSGSRIPHILMLGPAPSRQGGIAAVVAQYVESWNPGKYRLTRIATYDPAEPRVWVKARNALRALGQYVWILWRERFDILHVHFSWRGSFYRKSIFVLIARLFRVPRLVLHCHGGRFPAFYATRSAVGRWWIRTTVSAADRLLVVSNELRAFFEGLQTGTPVQVLANPVASPAGCRPATERLPMVISVGELREGKGTYDLLAAVPMVLEACPSAEFHLAGTGDLPRIEAMLAREPWGDRVKLLGWVGEEGKPALFARASVFVLPSHAEGLPVAILEAMAHGVPVVSTRIGGIPDAVLEGETGFLVEAGDAAAIASRVVRILRDPELAGRFADRSRERIRESYEAEAVMTHLYGMYDDLTSRG
jgi:glycosyltransferase involved in cell wall biosynthesis